jgi:hypothetical protein
MKNLNLLFCLLCLFALPSCGHHHDEDSKITSLNIDQVNKLAPFMVDLKKTGDPQSMLDTLKMGDSTRVMQHRNGQSYSFRIMTDENDHPVPPDSVSVMERKGGHWNNGEIQVWCLGGCIMVNTQLCLLNGCTPMDNACGCIPPVCGVCGNYGCSSIVSGFVGGGLVMR